MSFLAFSCSFDLIIHSLCTNRAFWMYENGYHATAANRMSTVLGYELIEWIKFLMQVCSYNHVLLYVYCSILRLSLTLTTILYHCVMCMVSSYCLLLTCLLNYLLCFNLTVPFTCIVHWKVCVIAFMMNWVSMGYICVPCHYLWSINELDLLCNLVFTTIKL